MLGEPGDSSLMGVSLMGSMRPRMISAASIAAAFFIESVKKPRHFLPLTFAHLATSWTDLRALGKRQRGVQIISLNHYRPESAV